MIRKLSLAVAVATALSPVGAFALGLGDIHSHSALNQSFNAEIDLLSVTQEEIQDIRVNLGSQEAFDRAGIERLFLLTGLKFTPMYGPSGKPVIAVTSNDPIREPFLNFLLEVNWPKGRMVREYTVLLDPPVTLNRAPAQVSAPRVSTAPATRSGSTLVRQSMAMPSPASNMGGREYGPVVPNDNLWSIAKGMRHSDESVEQVMMALQRYNPDAFINNNVNNLKVGKVLRLPEEADVTSLSRKAAREEFLAQTRAWRSGRGTASVPSTGARQAAAKAEDRLKLISPKKDAGEDVMTREGEAEVSRLEQEILLVRESNESALQENDALRNRVQELEKQIEDIQRLMTLKSDELSQMQQAQEIASEKMDEMQAPAVEEPPAEPETPVAEAPATEPAEMVEPQVTAVEKPPVVPIPEGTAIEEANIEAVIEETAQTETQAPATGEAAPAVKPEQPAVTEAPAKPAPVQPPAVPEPEKKVSYFGNLQDNTTLLGIV
ncbi:MAG: FimV/HubP family polar landmark protein, partial [Candidatus Thiodiazotropha sp.]